MGQESAKPLSQVVTPPLQIPALITEQSSELSDKERWLATPRRTTQGNAMQPHPPGFKEIHTRVEKFSGYKGTDFNQWLEDFEAASQDSCWDDNTQAKWFSWFLTGPT